MRAINLTSNKGNNIVNQIELFSDDGSRHFFSYGSHICKIEKGVIYINKPFYKFSRTTSKYLSIFLGKSSKEIEECIKKGDIKLINF